MSLVQAGFETSVIAQWLGLTDVRSAQPYLDADLTIREKALAVVAPADVVPAHDRPSDTTLAFLETL
jgi:hypothetical protein